MAPASRADHAEIDDLAAVGGDETISVRLRLSNAFGHREVDLLQSGLPLVFIYQIDLIRKRENWFDSILSSSEIEVVATYNSLTREYLLNYRRERKLVSSESVRSVEELKRKMTVLSEERLFPLPERPLRHLRIRSRAVLGRKYVLQVIPRLIATEWKVVGVQTQQESR